MRFSLLARTSLALAAGALLAAAFEPFAFAWAIPLAIAGLALTTRGLTAGKAWLPGLAFGLAYQFILLLWIRAIGPDAWIALSIVESLFFAALGSVFAIVGRLPGWPAWMAVTWIAVEQLRASFPFGGLPWGRLSFASIDTPIAAWLPYVGNTGASLVWALLGTLTAWFLVSLRVHPARALGWTAAVAVISLVPSWSPYDSTQTESITVAAVQGDVPGDGTDVLFDHRQVTSNHVAATVELANEVSAGRVPQLDFVVWPENSTAVDPFLDAEVNAGISAASAAIKVPILVGGIVQGPQPDEVLNQGIVWDPETGGGDRYTKRHPVPYGEYIPFREQLPFSANFGRLREIERDMLGGKREAPLEIGGVRVADSICFDVAYDDGIYEQVRQGSDLLVVQTSNAMFIETAQIEQQFAISRLRAIETGKYVVVAATNGVSGIIAPDGGVVARAQVRTQESVVADIQRSPDVPPGIRLGPILGWASALGTALGLALALGRRSVGSARVSSRL